MVNVFLQNKNKKIEKLKTLMSCFIFTYAFHSIQNIPISMREKKDIQILQY